MIGQAGLLGATLGRLRHPWLFAIAGAMLVTDLIVPDMVPFVDEILLAAATAGLALLRKRRVEKTISPEATEEAEETDS